MPLGFKKVEQTQDFKSIHEYTIDAFSDTDFSWTLDEIQKEVSQGWELWSVLNEKEEIIAALFFRVEGDSLLTKNSGLKIHHQGLGYSHEIKNYFEKIACERNLARIIHYCRIDNFRAYSLNEGHGYIKVASMGTPGEEEQIVEWIKILK